jgi:hypothetical protein
MLQVGRTVALGRTRGRRRAMPVAGRIIPVILIAAWGCGDEDVTAPVSAGLEGRYALAWSATRQAPLVTVVPGVPVPVTDCGVDAPPGRGTFTFSDSTALTIQESPQTYALLIVGRFTDCAGDQTRVFDVAVGDYLLVGEDWITLAGDLSHPNFDGQVVRTSGDTVTILLRPSHPGLGAPLDGLDRMAFTEP